MITPIRYNDLGKADHGWLKARHHFSFGSYYNPERMGFGLLRVINDDEIQPRQGFAPHPHKDMEIITYVRTGAITHKDSKGNEGRTQAGDVQVMSAGSGITHSEYNLEDDVTTLYQIWIEPKETGIEPRWDAQEFPKQPVTEHLTLLVSGSGDAPLYIHQDANIYAGILPQGTKITHHIQHQAYLLVAEGELKIGDHLIAKGDAAQITDETSIQLSAQADAEIVLIDVPNA